MNSNPEKNKDKVVGAMFPEYILKYGAIGVMAVWLFTLTNRMDDVEKRLYDCMEKRATPSACTQSKGSSNLIKELNPTLCIRPEELVIKNLKS